MGVVYLVRHGQASFGALDYDQLSPLGVEQSAIVGRALRGRIERVDRVVAGSLRRHRDTARHALEAAGIDVTVEEDAAWNEFDHEELLRKHEPAFADPPALYAKIAALGDPREAFTKLFRDAIARWIGGAHDHDYAETWGGFRARCEAALASLIAALGASKTAVVFTSGGPISLISAHLLGLPEHKVLELPARVVNCSVTKIVYGASGPVLSTFNEHAWFEGPNRKSLTYR